MVTVSSYIVCKYLVLGVCESTDSTGSLSFHFFFAEYYCQDVRRWPSDCTVVVNCTTKDNQEAITVRALHPFLSRVTHIVKIGALCWAQGHLNRRHVSSWTYLIFSWNQICDLSCVLPHLVDLFKEVKK